MGRYTDIIARLESASGPDRELDATIEDELLGYVVKGLGPLPGTPRFTASLYAAIGLVKRVIATNERRLICFFCAGGQLTPANADEESPDYHPLARIDNSITVGWMAHVAFYQSNGESIGAKDYSHGRTAPIAVLLALFRALEAQEAGE